MSYNVNATFLKEQIKVDDVAPIHMYVVNASITGKDHLYFANYNQDIYGYEVNKNGQMVASPIKYTGLPIQQNEMKIDTSGEIAQVDISIPNVDRVMEGYVQTIDYLRGRDVYLITTFERTLPASPLNPEYVGDSDYEDYHAVMIEKLYVDGTISDEQAVTFSCKPKFVVRNVVLPNRRYSRECQWTYLSSECDINGEIDSVTYTTCDRTLEQCRERTNATQFGGFPSIPKRMIYI